MSKYGYVGKESDIPQQAFKANAGVLSVNDHLALSQENKLTQFGQLELIETQSSSSSTATVNFESIQESQYNVHFLTFSEGQSNGFQYLSLRFGNDGTYQTSGYQYARQSMLNSTFGEDKSTSESTIRIGSYVYRGENAYAYIYNIGDSSKYTFATSQMVGNAGNYVGCASSFGSGVYPSATSFNNIQILRTSGVSWTGGFKASLYGIKEYS